MNKTILTGRLTADASIKPIGNNILVNFTVANNDASYKNDEGTWIDKPVFVECALWKRKDVNMEWITKSLIKGVEVLVEGVPSVNAYISKEDNQVKSSLTIKVDRYQVFGIKPQGTASGATLEDLEKR